MMELYFILALIAIRVIADSFLFARAIANVLLKEDKAGRRFFFWFFMYLSDLVLLTVGIAALVLIF